MNTSVLFDLLASLPQPQILLFQKDASYDSLLAPNYSDIIMFREQQGKIWNLPQALVHSYCVPLWLFPSKSPSLHSTYALISNVHFTT